MAHVRDVVTGARFGRLTVKTLHPIVSGMPRLVDTVCDCGTAKTLAVPLLGRSTNSCGCWRKEQDKLQGIIHGMRHSREYEIWSGMIKRCKNMADPRYGGRGITVSEDWKKFENFYRDMGSSGSFQLERVDNDSGYSKENCIWATRAVQSRNKCNNIYVLYEGVKYVLKDAAKIVNVQYKTVHMRLYKAHWPVSKALGVKFSWPDGINPYTGKPDA